MLFKMIGLKMGRLKTFPLIDVFEAGDSWNAKNALGVLLVQHIVRKRSEFLSKRVDFDKLWWRWRNGCGVLLAVVTSATGRIRVLLFGGGGRLVVLIVGCTPR